MQKQEQKSKDGTAKGPRRSIGPRSKGLWGRLRDGQIGNFEPGKAANRKLKERSCRPPAGDDRRRISAMMRTEPWLESARDYARIEQVVFRVAIVDEGKLTEAENERLDRLSALINAYDAGSGSRQSSKRLVVRLSPADLRRLARRLVAARTQREADILTRKIVDGFYGR